MRYPLAIVDYGVGGLGLYQLVRSEFPNMPILYFSDSGEVPYGKQSKATLRARLEQVFQFLFAKGAEMIVVACHSGSSVVRDSDKGVVGIRKATLAAMDEFEPKHVGVIGGGRTIKSRFYRLQLQQRGWKVSQRIAQPLSILVERGEVNTDAVIQQVATIMKPLRRCDYVLLACTHYPVLSGVISKNVSRHCRLIDPVAHLLRAIRPHLNKHRSKRGRSTFLTTGDTRKMQLAAKGFGVHQLRAQRVLVASR